MLAQNQPTDSAGVDSRCVLKRYEIAYLDTVVFEPRVYKKATYDIKDGFDFTNKNVAFYSCAYMHDGNDGFITKDEFFAMADRYMGPRGLEVFNEVDKAASGGFDVVIVAQCKMIVQGEVLKKLKARRAANNLLPGQKR